MAQALLPVLHWGFSVSCRARPSAERSPFECESKALSRTQPPPPNLSFYLAPTHLSALSQQKLPVYHLPASATPESSLNNRSVRQETQTKISRVNSRRNTLLTASARSTQPRAPLPPRTSSKLPVTATRSSSKTSTFASSPCTSNQAKSRQCDFASRKCFLFSDRWKIKNHPAGRQSDRPQPQSRHCGLERRRHPRRRKRRHHRLPASPESGRLKPPVAKSSPAD